MGYVSRKYLKEKYEHLKNNMEKVLDVLNEDKNLPDKIPEEDVKRCLYNIEDSCESIINEIRHCKY